MSASIQPGIYQSSSVSLTLSWTSRPVLTDRRIIQQTSSLVEQRQGDELHEQKQATTQSWNMQLACRQLVVQLECQQVLS